MDLLSTVRKSGSRAGVNFSWDEVANSNHRENYLGHSLKAPVGRWAKGRDLSWYAKSDPTGANADETNEERDERERKEELRKVKEAEEDAIAKALGLPPPQRDASGANSVEAGIEMKEIVIEGDTGVAAEARRGDITLVTTMAAIGEVATIEGAETTEGTTAGRDPDTKDDEKDTDTAEAEAPEVVMVPEAGATEMGIKTGTDQDHGTGQSDGGKVHSADVADVTTFASFYCALVPENKTVRSYSYKRGVSSHLSKSITQDLILRPYDLAH